MVLDKEEVDVTVFVCPPVWDKTPVLEFVGVFTGDLLNKLDRLAVKDILEVPDLRPLELAVLEAVEVFDIGLLFV